MKKEHRIVMLSTNKGEGALSEGGSTGLHTKLEFGVNQHLYLLSDDKIKEGDWYIWLNNNQLCKAHTGVIILNSHLKDGHIKKVITSTDSELYKLHDNGALGQGITILPQFSEEFIQAYCKAGGIDKVLVEYEDKGHFSLEHMPNWQLKLRDDNTVIISSVKTNYTKQDLPIIIKNILNDLNEDQEKLPTDKDMQEYIKKWVDNNL